MGISVWGGARGERTCFFQLQGLLALQGLHRAPVPPRCSLKLIFHSPRRGVLGAAQKVAPAGAPGEVAQKDEPPSADLRDQLLFLVRFSRGSLIERVPRVRSTPKKQTVQPEVPAKRKVSAKPPRKQVRHVYSFVVPVTFCSRVSQDPAMQMNLMKNLNRIAR
jgi:hypothetical protein